MLILGANTDDKGCQLEDLTRRLLTVLGYRNIVQSEIIAGGSEVDVAAEFTIPGLMDRSVRRRLCECKATRSPVDLPQWLKFLGKIFTEEKKQKQEVFGTFIALNGVNGNVAGHFHELHEDVGGIELVHGDNLREQIRKLTPIPAFEDVASLVKRLSGRSHERLDIAYYAGEFYWVVVFTNGEYSVLSSSGGPMLSEVAAKIKPLVESELNAMKFVNLHAQAAAIEAHHAVMASVLGKLLSQGGSMPIESALAAKEQHTEDELCRAIDSLKAETFVEGDHKEIRIPGMPESLPSVDERLRILFFLLNHGLPLSVLGCPLYDKFIDESLLDKMCQIQEGLHLSGENRKQVLRLIQWSPSALALLISPNPRFVGHRKALADREARMDEQDQKYLLKALHDALKSDHRKSGLAAYFFDMRDVREIESVETVIAKGSNGELHRSEVKERIAIARADATLGGGHVVVNLVHDAPPPWKWGDWKPEPENDSAGQPS